MALPAWAVVEGEPYLKLRHARTNNLFDAPSSPDAAVQRPRVSETQQIVTIGGVLQYTWGLQKATANAEAARVLHDDADDLDHNTHVVGAGLDWQIARLWEGRVAAERRREQERFADRDNVTLGLLDRTTADVSVRWKPTPRWALEPSLGVRDVAHKRETSRDADRDDVVVGLQGLYTGNPVATVGVGVDVTTGRFPNRRGQPQRFGTIGDGFQQTDAYARVDYRFSGLSTVQAELGYSWRDTRGLADDVVARDLTGAIGRIQYLRQHSALTQLRLELFRALDSVEEVDAVSAERTGFVADLSYLPTRRVRLQGLYRYERLDFLGGGFDLVQEAREDRVDAYRVALRYQPLFWLGISGGVESERRRSNREDRSFDTRLGFIELEARYD